MRYLVILLLFLSALCAEQASNSTIVTFPLYEECDTLIPRLKKNLSASAGSYEVHIIKNDFDLVPRYGNFPYGIGSVEITGELNLLNGTLEEYLSLHISSIFSDCLPNNAVAVGDPSLASEIQRKAGSGVVSGQIVDGIFYLLVNDGSYRYE